MTIMQILFIIISLITLVSGWIVVSNRNIFHAALAMMTSFLGVAGLYVLLEAGFLAAAQLLVYIGAISILVIFAIMMTRRMMQTTETPYNNQWIWSGVAAILLLALILVVFWPIYVNPSDPQLAAIYALPGAPDLDPTLLEGMVVNLGQLLVNADALVIPFEIASVLLLAALIGSIVIARPERER